MSPGDENSESPYDSRDQSLIRHGMAGPRRAARGKENSGLEGLAALAARAEAVDLEAVSYDIVVAGVAHSFEHVFDVREVDILGGAAADTNEVMVMGLMADAIADRAIAEHDAADEAAVEQQLQCAVDRSAADGVELGGKLFGGEVILTRRDVFDYLITRRGDLEALITQLADQALSRCL